MGVHQSLSQDCAPASSHVNLMITCALGLVDCSTAISTQSYWIDEAGTAWKALEPTLSGWWHSMRAEGHSNLQLPLCLLLVWAWEKVAGLNDFALRAGNILWFLPGLFAMWFVLKGSVRRGFSLALLSSPFAWHYLNEARSHTMQLGAALFIFSSLFQIRRALEAPVRNGAGWSLSASVRWFLPPVGCWQCFGSEATGPLQS